jgi:hypothetical protein
VTRGLQAGLLAGLVSGIPSTAAALARGDDPLEATLAAGAMLLRDERRRYRLLAAAVPVHVAVSLFWGVVLERALPSRRPVVAGAIAGLGIGILDLEILARPFPRVRALPLGPQLADHALYGATVGYLLAQR